MGNINKLKLDDIARLAGVSTATVSRCFNTPEKVNKKTKDKVLAIIDKTGFTPNFRGRLLASSRSNTVGVIIPTMENAIFARGVQAFQEKMSESNITILVACSNYAPEREYRQIHSLVNQGVDGLFLIGMNRPDKTYDFLTSRGIPFVLTWNYRPNSDFLTVGFNNKEAAHTIASKVISLGHTRIAMISASTHGNDRAYDRLEGVRLAMHEAGIVPSTLKVITTNYSLTCGGDAFQYLMSQHHNPTVIICGNDILACGAIQRARAIGISIPQNVSITGFDDIDIAQIITPQLTTIHAPHRRMGQQAAEQLLAAINGTEQLSSINIDYHLVHRESLSTPT